MSDCLSKEEIELLNSRCLRGARLVKALKHLENCEKCRLQIKLPSKEQILRRIFDDEDEIKSLLAPKTKSQSKS